MRRYRHDDEEDALDANGLLKDGRSLRVSVLTRDAATTATKTLDARQQAREEWIAHISDAWRTPPRQEVNNGDTPLPTFTIDTTTADARDNAYREMVQQAQDAWKC